MHKWSTVVILLCMRPCNEITFEEMFLQKNNFDFMVCMMEKNVDIKKAQPSTKIYVSYDKAMAYINSKSY